MICREIRTKHYLKSNKMIFFVFMYILFFGGNNDPPIPLVHLFRIFLTRTEDTSF